MSQQFVSTSTNNVKMETLLSDADCILKKFFNPQTKDGDQVPPQLLENSAAIVIFKIFNFRENNDVNGNGILLIKNKHVNNNNELFNGIYAINMYYLNKNKKKFFVFNDLTYHIMVIKNEEILKKILYQKEVIFDSEIQNPLNMESFSLFNNNHIPFNFDDFMIKINDECNEQYYKAKLDSNSILNGNVKVPLNEDYYKICGVVKDYLKQNRNESSNDQKEVFLMSATTKDISKNVKNDIIPRTDHIVEQNIGQ